MKKKQLLKQIKNNELNIALISDLHLAIHKKENIFFPHLKKTVNFFIEQCEKNKTDIIIIPGDLFDTKMTISTDGLINSNNLVYQMAEHFPVILIPGNHDYATIKDEWINLPSNYKHHNNIYVVKQYDKIETETFVLHFLPYKYNPIKHIKNINIVENKNNIFFGHLGVSGFKIHDYASTYANEKSAQISIPDLTKFDACYLGHYHGFQTGNNITYVSSPLQSRHGDEKSLHGFVFLNTKNPTKHIFVENKHTPRFISFKLNKKNAQEMLKLKNHYIRIFVTKKINKNLLFNLKKRLIKNNYDVSFAINIIDNNKLAVIEGWKDIVLNDPEELIIDYFDMLLEENKLPFDKLKLLKALNINPK